MEWYYWLLIFVIIVFIIKPYLGLSSRYQRRMRLVKTIRKNMGVE
jgi:hypothetical protein